MNRTPFLTAALVLTILTSSLATTTQALAHDDRWQDNRHHDERYNGRGHDDDRGWDDRGRGRDRNNSWPRQVYDYNDSYSTQNIVRINISPWDRKDLSREIDREYWEKCRTVAGQRYYNCSNYSGHGMSYRIGQKLPPQAVAWNVPRNALTYLPRASHGTRYIWVDRDILLISSNSGIILDAVRVR